ncbi:MAG: GGDEF domain-containing protein [bacterium]
MEIKDIKDELTNFFNYTYFQLRLSEEMTRAKRYNLPISLLVIDIDHSTNEEISVGSLNKILKRKLTFLAEISNRINTQLRKIDIPARYSANSIAIILTMTDKKGAFVLGKRIHKAINSYQLSSNKTDIPINVSIGIVSYPEDGKDEQKLIKNINYLISQAKKLGGNRIISIKEK